MNAVNLFGNTRMHYAVGNENFDIIKLLVKYKINLKLQNREGITPPVAAQKTDGIQIRDYLKVALFKQLE